MEDSVAHAAVRQLTIDIANLTGRLAILQASLEFVQVVASRVRPEEWPRILSEKSDGEPRISLQGEQADAIEQLLVALNSLG